MENSKVLIYDGSFNGFLTAIFTSFEGNIEVLGFQRETSTQKGLFAQCETIETQISKAKRVWEGIEKKSHTVIRNIYFAFLSEANGVDFMLYQYIKKLYNLLDPIDNDHASLIEIKISKLALQVSREKAQIENLIDFQLTNDDVYSAEIEPGFNILPLISRHFRNRFPKHQWIIFDRKRKYGVYYNGINVEIISKETKNLYLNAKSGFYPNTQNLYRVAI